MKTIISLLSLCCILAATASGQASPGSAHFAVVSIKPDAPGSRPHVIRVGAPAPGPVFPGGKYIDRRTVLWTLIEFAYPGVIPRQTLLGLPAWAFGPDQFDFEAQAAAGTEPSREQMRQMMRAALAKRFKLQFANKTQVMPVYFLKVAAGGVRNMHPAGPGEIGTPVALMIMPNQVGIAARGVSLSALGDALAPLLLGRPVMDHTGLAGSYDINLPLRSESLPRPGAAADRKGAALRALGQLGLTLVAGTAPVSVMVVHHVEHPTLN
ncbi:MAG TPA: TIGR03435 family protein [Terriglobales bacterium]|nr:TIGR03435 family protein [Terriglobales bacterium]